MRTVNKVILIGNVARDPLVKTVENGKKIALFTVATNRVIKNARGEVINEAEMVEFMTSRPDFKYVTDIVPGNDEEMVQKFANRYFTTPKKMGAQTSEANINAGIAAAKQIADFLNNGIDTFRVNK